MGATTFENVGKGKTAQDAFKALVEESRHMNGHGGYTGTIAEKRDFVTITCPQGTDPRVFASKLIDDGDPRIDDKWGPAGCIAMGKGVWLFFGWASE